MLVRGLAVLLLVAVRLSRGVTPSEEGKGARGLWEQFPGPTNLPQSIRDGAGPSSEGMSRARAVTGGFWGQIVEKNMGVEGRSSPRRTRLATSQSGTRRSGSSKRRSEKKGGSGRRRKEPEFDIPDFGVDRMGSLGEDYYEYLDDYGEDLGNIDMVEEEDFLDKPIDTMEAHRWIPFILS